MYSSGGPGTLKLTQGHGIVFLCVDDGMSSQICCGQQMQLCFRDGGADGNSGERTDSTVVVMVAAVKGGCCEGEERERKRVRE